MTRACSARSASRTRRTVRSLQVCGALAALLVGSHPVAADRYVATVAFRPIGGIGRFTENVAGDGHGASAAVNGGGGELSVGYGVRNWLLFISEARLTSRLQHPNIVRKVLAPSYFQLRPRPSFWLQAARAAPWHPAVP
jgi:hypothetical protein